MYLKPLTVASHLERERRELQQDALIGSSGNYRGLELHRKDKGRINRYARRKNWVQRGIPFLQKYQSVK